MTFLRGVGRGAEGRGDANSGGILNVTYNSQRWRWAVLYIVHLSSLVSISVLYCIFVPGEMRMQCGVMGAALF